MLQERFNAQLSLNKISVGVGGICIDRQIKADSMVTLWWSCAPYLEECHKLWLYNKDDGKRLQNKFVNYWVLPQLGSLEREHSCDFFRSPESKLQWLCYLTELEKFFFSDMCHALMSVSNDESLPLVPKQREEKRVWFICILRSFQGYFKKM